MIRNRAFLADVPAHNPRPKRMADPRYLAWVRQLPCVLCLRQPGMGHQNEAHHLLRGVVRGMGMKAGDDEVIPLCDGDHRALHMDGNETEFLAKRGIDCAVSLAAMIRTAYLMGDIGRARAAVINARAR